MFSLRLVGRQAMLVSIGHENIKKVSMAQEPETRTAFQAPKAEPEHWRLFSGTETGTGTVHLSDTVQEHGEKRSSVKEQSEPRIRAVETVPCRNRDRTEPNWGHSTMYSEVSNRVMISVAWGKHCNVFPRKRPVCPKNQHMNRK